MRWWCRVWLAGAQQAGKPTVDELTRLSQFAWQAHGYDKAGTEGAPCGASRDAHLPSHGWCFPAITAPVVRRAERTVLYGRHCFSWPE